MAAARKTRRHDANRKDYEYDAFDDDVFFTLEVRNRRNPAASSTAEDQPTASEGPETTAMVVHKARPPRDPRAGPIQRSLLQTGLEASAGDDEYIQIEDGPFTTRNYWAQDVFDGWHARMDMLVKAHHLQPRLNKLRRPPSTIKCDCGKASESRLTVFDYSGRTRICQSVCAEEMAAVFYRNRLFPATPSQPRAAFALSLLRLYQGLRKGSNVGAYNMMNALEDLYRSESPAMTISGHAKNQLMAASIWYQATQVYTSRSLMLGGEEWKEPRPALYRDDLKLTPKELADSCPACFHALVARKSTVKPPGTRRLRDADINPTAGAADAADTEGPPPAGQHMRVMSITDPSVPSPTGTEDNLSSGSDAIGRAEEGSAQPPQVIVSIDGNFSQKRKKRKNVLSRQALPPRRFLSQEQVDRAERDLLSARLVNGQGGHQCSAKVKAGDPEAAKGAMGPHDITGVMGLCCRHDVPLIFCDITSPGERHHYAVALLQCLFEALKGRLKSIGVMYDIGCRFAPNENIKTILDPDVAITWSIPLFHVYGHTLACQIQYSPRRVKDMGWTDGEGMERVWSGVSTLVASARSMSQAGRRFHLEERLDHLATMRRRTLAKWIMVKTERIKGIEDRSLALLGEDTASEAVLVAVMGKDAPAKFPTQTRPKHLGDIAIGSYDVLHYMSEERRKQALRRSETQAEARKLARALEKARNRAGEAAKQTEDPTEDNEEMAANERDPDKRCGAPGDGIEDVGPEQPKRKRKRRRKEGTSDGTAAAEKMSAEETQAATKTLADALFGILANYHSLQAQARDRKGQRYSTDILEQLNVSIAKEKKAAIAAKSDLNAHLEHAFDDYKPITTKWLFEDWCREWVSAVATEGSIQLPWWTDREVTRVVDAFADVLRIAEERERLEAEKQNIIDWIDAKIVDVDARVSERGHSEVGARLQQELKALRKQWAVAGVSKSPQESRSARAGRRMDNMRTDGNASPRPAGAPALADVDGDGEDPGSEDGQDEEGDGMESIADEDDYGEEWEEENGEGWQRSKSKKALDPMEALNEEAFGWTSNFGMDNAEVVRLARICA